MDDVARKFLDDLLTTPSCSGYEQPVQAVVRAFAEPFAEEVVTDVHGNVLATLSKHASRRAMFAGHCDQIGLVVSSIDEQGYLYCQTVGGWDPQQLVGQGMTVWTSGGPLPGVISRKPIHLLTEGERKQVVKIEDLWLDIGARDQNDASKRVSVGDPVTLRLGARELLNGLISGPKMDNTSGLWVCFEALRRAGERGLKWSLTAVSTVQEEVGLRGARTSAFGLDPHAAIAVDVTHATDCPSVDVRQLGVRTLGGGPVVFRGPNVNPRVHEQLVRLAEEQALPFQTAAIGRAAPNDANALQVTRQGVATGLVAIPNRYMHSAVETIALSDLDSAAELLAQWACGLDETTHFTP